MRSDPVAVTPFLIINTLSKKIGLFWYPKNIPSRWYCPGKDILHAFLRCHSCFALLVVNLSILNHLNNKDFSSFRVNWKNVVFKLLHIHPRGRSFRLIQLKPVAFCLSTEQNRTWSGRLSSVIELTSSINRTHRKVPVRLCSITEGEPIEQQPYRLGSIEFDWLLVRFRREYLITLQPVNEIVQEWVTSEIE